VYRRELKRASVMGRGGTGTGGWRKGEKPGEEEGGSGKLGGSGRKGESEGKREGKGGREVKAGSEGE